MLPRLVVQATTAVCWAVATLAHATPTPHQPHVQLTSAPGNRTDILAFELAGAVCAEAVAGGSELQRRSRQPEDKAAVHALLCSDDCAPAAREAYGARAFEILCAGPGAVTDPGGGIWGLAAPKLQQTSELGIAAGLDDAIGSFGGISSLGLTVASGETYIASDNEWRQVTPIPLPTNHPMPASTVDGRIFLAGGGLFPLGNPDRDTMYEFEDLLDGERWSERAPMPTSRSAGAAAAIDSKVFIAGGWPPHGTQHTVECRCRVSRGAKWGTVHRARLRSLRRCGR